MNHIPSSSSSSATPPNLLVHPARSASNISSNTQSTSTLTPAIIPLDYNYQTMSPSSLSQFRNDCITSPVTTNTNTSASYNLHPHSRLSSARPSGTVSVDVELDNQYSSLFGDPVPPPPPPDFLTTQFDPVSLFRPSSLDISSGSDEDATGRLVSLETDRPANTRLFSNVPFSSLFSRRSSDTIPQRNFAVLPTPLPRLQPPDIQILPNSSGGSSSEAHESPNYALLTPDNVTHRHSVYDATDAPDVTEIIESLEVRDAKGVREYSEATRRVSNFSEDFKSNVGALSNTQETEIVDLPSPANHSFPHQFSNEHYASSEWFRPAAQDYPEFSKIPRLRPSSKNIMSIKREEMPMHHSPVAAMINDSNGSSSGEERLVDKAEAFEHENVALDILQPPERPPDPSPSLLREIETDLLLSPQGYLPQQTGRTIDSLNQQNFPTPPPPAAPPPPDFFTPSPGENEGSIRREMSPVILTDSIATGGDFRVDQPRLHKKTSFTIISDKSPQSSRTQSPSPFNQRSPSKISGLSNSSTIKPVAKPRQYLQQKSLSSIQLKLPQLPQQKFQGPVDDSPRPSVQFNMTGRHTPKMMTQRGILQNRESLSSSQDITPMSPSAALTSASKLRRPAALPSFAKPANESKMKSCEALPLITCPYRTAIPRLNRSITDLHREPAVFPPGALPRPLKPNPNPTRKQKGLLRILNGDTSHIPLRSIWASMDDLALGRQLKTPLSTPIRELKARRRSSSTSPERRSSTQTASDRRSSNLSSITTSDFSFRRSSIAGQQQRRKTVCPLPSPKMKRRLSLIPGMSLTGGLTSRAKIAKPSTLSPIIGTPNKDSSTPQSPEQNGLGSLAPSETISDVTSQRDSFSKIPVRPHHSRPSSRSSSPLKEFTAQLPLADPNSRGTSSRTASRATAKNEASQSTSRANSRPVSRSTSRASTHPMSRAASRSSTRPNSRVEMAKDIANSRSSSRMSMRSVNSLARNSSPAPGKRSAEHSPLPIRRRKSISVSPVLNQRSRTRRQSLSPPNKKRSGSRGREKKMRERSESRHSSQSRIPLRAGSVTKPTRSSSKPGVVKQSKSRSPAKSKETKSMRVASPTRISPNQRTKTISAKKAQTSVHKPTSSAKRTPSSVSKQTTSVKKEPSDLQKTAGTNLRREVSNLQKKDATIIGVGKTELRESTIAATRTKRAGASGSAATVALAASGLKRQTTSKTLGKATTKRQVAVLKGKGIESKTNAEVGKETGNAKKDDAMTKLEEEKSANGKDTESNLTGSSPIGMEAAKAGAIPASVAAGVAASTTIRGSANISSGSTGGSGSTSTIKRQPSNVGLVRMASRMSLLSMKRSDSNLSKKTTVRSVAEETITTSKANGKPATLQKSNSRTQLRTPENASALPAAILEKSQKTLENIQKTVTVATDEIQKTIHENLTDLKSFESDMGRQWSDSAGSPTSSVATVVENKAAGKAGGVGGVGGVGGGGSGGGVGESIARSGTAEESTTTAGAAKVSQKNGSSSVTPAASTQKSPLPPTQPIEADVSVLNATAHTTQYATVAAAAAAAATTGAMTMPLAGAVDATVERVSERAISVMPEVDCDDANFQNFAYDGDGATDTTADGAFSTMLMSGEAHANVTGASGNGRKGLGNGEGGEGDGHGDGDHDIKRRSPDGQGGSAADSGNGSREFLKEQDDDSAPPTGCCRCCTKFCLPCRRLRCLRCCCRKKSKTGDESEEPVLLATSSASTTNLEVVDEARHSADGKTKTSCWQKFNCCKRCRKQPKISAGSSDEHAKMTVMAKTETAAAAGAATTAPKQGKCGLCISKLFCCRRVNKVDPTTGDETELEKCCFCIPCRRKTTGRGAAIGSTVSPAGSVAWQDPESGIAATDASVLEGTTSAEMQPKQGCCKRFWSTLLCCRRNKIPKISESRRASMKAPPPPSEDTRRKLHADLVEYNSKMKGAIPVLPLSLAWFCVICNTIFPGLGTLFSGIFCLCVGIPRFSQYDSAKARFGSFIINVIVATAQLFCVLFCFVGWGWSIWWGTIMLKCARKLHKIKKVERLEMEEERRQAEAAAVAAVTTTRVPANSGPNAASAPITTESSA